MPPIGQKVEISPIESCYMRVAKKLSASHPIVQDLEKRVPNYKQGDESVAAQIVTLKNIISEGEVGLEEIKCLNMLSWCKEDREDLIQAVEAILKKLREDYTSFENIIRSKKEV